MEVSGQCYALAALSPGKEPRYTLDKRLGGIWGVDVKIHSSLTSILDGGEWSVLRSGRFIPGKEPVHFGQEAGWAP
jgi:hypothetical protein